jgi:hypothetical protein
MWIITKDKIDDNLSKGRTSSDFDQNEWDKKKVEGKTDKFRLLDDDGEIYFYGEWDGLNRAEWKAFAPLDEWGSAFGCTELQYKDKVSKEWKPL